MDKNLKKMIDNVADGDMAAAGDAFMAAADARRGEAWQQAKTDYAQRAFKEVDLGQVTSGIDTGITGDPAEVDEGSKGDMEVNRLFAQQARRRKEAARKAEREAKRTNK